MGIMIHLIALLFDLKSDIEVIEQADGGITLFGNNTSKVYLDCDHAYLDILTNKTRLF